ncbi:ATP-dependent Clp protease adaptor ClpS [Leptospira ilyithenensis]|uniref:ATP-dependent Clp protease adaptor ClpS n=1 Tax=Leptospira ilyithenensis TaxID=2484901 RepID=A0A4V3JXF9_9LEPT|nr:ATP-dependent Clp protease adaptor ClpS [Leptospira ilyithenensis]TGN14267.1 ATP-dependent Clp protease adaptor ClpS [Leptospira ilyithenensis]
MIFANAQPGVLEETETIVKLGFDGPWLVVLWDDDHHTYDYVIEMLMDVCQMPWEKAFQHAIEVDTKKRTVVFSGELEHAEFVQERIIGYGPDPRMVSSKGSMTATLEN